MLHRWAPIYWRLQAQINSRTLAFFVSERRSRPPVPDRSDIRCGGVELADLVTRLAALRGDDPYAYRARLTDGHFVVCAVGANGDLQSWGWLTVPTNRPQDAPWEFGIRLQVMPGTGYLWDYFTVPEYRRRGLYRFVLRHAAERCFIRGAQQAWGYADVTNSPSCHGLAGAGYAPGVEIHLRRLGPFCRISRPGFQRNVRVDGAVPMDAMLQG